MSVSLGKSRPPGCDIFPAALTPMGYRLLEPWCEPVERKAPETQAMPAAKLSRGSLDVESLSGSPTFMETPPARQKRDWTLPRSLAKASPNMLRVALFLVVLLGT